MAGIDLSSPLLVTDLLTLVYLLAQFLFVLAVSIFALSSIDDLLLDAVYFAGRWRRNRHGAPAHDAPLLPETLLAKPEQYLAIMLPAWQESGILLASVTNILKTLNYSKVHIFIGTYPNDPETQVEADKLASRFSQVHKVVTRLPGPTCKADCLNAIIARIEQFASEQQIDFKAFILQDAEDVVHPMSLKLFNYYLPEYDLIQIPVLSLPRKWHDFTGGHYMDEFAEVHTKEVKARQYLADVVPGAGVGTAYSQRVIRYAATKGEIFNTASLTEDYEFSFRLRKAGFKQIFARLVIPRPDDQAQPTEIIATRELFPNRFWASVRQKTRWIIGISLQGWQSLGWEGSWRIRYLYWRDRKTIFFSHAIVAGFTATLIFSLFYGYQASFPEGYRMAPLLAEDSPFWFVVYFNLTVLIYRLLQRCWWTRLCYGWGAVAGVVPRYAWGAVINYLATVRATKIYLAHLLTKKPIGWDKTAHDFPEDHQASLPAGSLDLPSHPEPALAGSLRRAA